MRIIADLHIHSKYSRATSQDMGIPNISHYAQLKGLNLVGTGDFTHPKWFLELKEVLTAVQNTGLYTPTANPQTPIYYMITSEVSTVFEYQGRSRKVHHVILTPSLEIAAQINEKLSKWGDLTVDGRPMLSVSAPELVEEVMALSKDNEVFPAHAWTPWFSIFGAFSGFDRVEDCYQEMTKHIHALETGLSSDPPMNWRLSSLDRFALVSNSDSHSAWPWRLGREANVFEVETPTYYEIIDAIRKKDPERFKFTIETQPAYGKYHWTGHRNCNISMSPAEAIKFGNICPVCRKRLTKGVEQRVEELADRPTNFKPDRAIPFKYLLPLHEIIASSIGAEQIASRKVWEIYNTLITKLGDEYTILLDVPEEKLAEVTDPKIAESIIRVRENRVQVIPGYDGVYGKLIIFPEEKEARGPQSEVKKHKGLEEFM